MTPAKLPPEAVAALEDLIFESAGRTSKSSLIAQAVDEFLQRRPPDPGTRSRRLARLAEGEAVMEKKGIASAHTTIQALRIDEQPA